MDKDFEVNFLEKETEKESKRVEEVYFSKKNCLRKADEEANMYMYESRH